MASGIYFSGLSSGLDTSSIVSKLTQLARAPIDRLNTQKSNLTTQKTEFNKIRGLVSSLELAAKALDTPEEFSAFSTTSSDETVVKAAAGTGASPGTFNVKVHHLAAAQRTYSEAYNSKTTVGLFGTGLSGTGTLKITVGSADPVNIVVDGSTTLESLASSINSQVSGVNASILYDGSQYRLQVSAKQTGLAGKITFDDTGLNLGLSTLANTAQPAQDLLIDIDDIPISRSTNVVNDAIPGVTLDLKSASASDGMGGYVPTSVTVAVDQSGIVKKIQTFVDAYNAVVKEVAAQTTPGQTYDPSRLVGDSTLRGMMRDLTGSMTASVQGLTESPYSLSQVGIKTQADGTLSVDSGKLTTALSSNIDSVQRLFISNSALGSTGVSDRVSTMADQYSDTIDGRLTVRIQSLTKRISSVASDVSSIEDRVAKYEQQLQSQFNALEKLMTSLQTQSSYLTQMLG